MILSNKYAQIFGTLEVALNQLFIDLFCGCLTTYESCKSVSYKIILGLILNKILIAKTELVKQNLFKII